MKCGHLFNGIGGFALAASWMNWENVMHCEIDPFCNRVMNHHFPNSFQHEDIRTTDFGIWRGRIDLITGGFPCQPYSTAGKRAGSADDRHLWPEMLRAIREISPRWIVAENVRGLVNWNKGMVFDQVQADMETAGYEVIPFLLPAAGVGAPHRRDRIWFVAYRADAGVKVLRQPGENKICKPCAFADSIGFGYTERETFAQGQQYDGGRQARCKSESFGGAWFTANAISKGLPVIACGEQREISRSAKLQQRSKPGGTFTTVAEWQNFPSKPPVCTGNDGLPGGLADIAVPSKKYGTRILRGKQVYGWWRKECLKSLGNAVVPELPFEIFKAIEQYEKI